MPDEKPRPRMEVNLTVRVNTFWCPEDFEGSEEWDQFIGKMLTDPEFARKTVMEQLAYEYFDDAVSKIEKVEVVHIPAEEKKNAQGHK